MGGVRAAARAHLRTTGADGVSADGVAELVIASILRPEGRTGVHTHIREFRRYLESERCPFTLLTPYSWSWPLAVLAFAPRLLLAKVHKSASVAWYYHFHEVFLRRALRRHLAAGNVAVVYAQGPREARAALRARRGPEQQVVMVVHYLTSQADEWVDKHMLRPGNRTFRHIRRVEADTIARLDGIVYVTGAARDALMAWLPTKAPARTAVVSNFITPFEIGVPGGPEADLVTVGSLELHKNHAYLLDILAAANRMGRRYTLDVFGAGSQRGPLVKRAGELGLSGQVRFMGFRPDVRTSLAAHRAYVHTSAREAHPIAVIEAMAAGLPLLVAPSGGIAEVCDEESGARLWPLDDATRAASILIELMEDDVERARAACRALAAFRERFDAAAVAPRLYRFLMDDPLLPARKAEHPVATLAEHHG